MSCFYIPVPNYHSVTIIIILKHDSDENILQLSLVFTFLSAAFTRIISKITGVKCSMA